GVPGEWRRKCLRECDGAERLLREGIARWIDVDGIRGPIDTRLRDACVNALDGLASFRTAIARDVPPTSSPGYAAGADFFDLLLARGHWSRSIRADLKRE